MKQKPFKISLEATSFLFNKCLPKYGFSNNYEKISGTVMIRKWSRKYDWKEDTIEIRYHRGNSNFRVNLFVYLPLDSSLNFEGDNIFSGLGIDTPLVPLFFAKIRSGFYAKNVLSKLTSKIDWFEGYSTPDKCIEKLKDPNRNGPVGGKVLENMTNKFNNVAHLID